MPPPAAQLVRPSRPPSSAWAAWGAVCVIWGTTYLAIRVALETIPPGLLGGIRFTVAGTVLCLVLRMRGDRLPPRAEWPRQALIGVLMLGIGNGFVVLSEQWIPSGIAAVSVASAPFWMTGIDASTGGERLTLRLLTGFATGFSGILVLVWPDLFARRAGGLLFVTGIVLAQLACLGWSVGSSLSKRFTPSCSALAASALQQLAGGLVMLTVGTAAGEWATVSLSGRSLVAELYLIAFGSLAAYSAYVYALQHLPIATVSLYAYINPIIAVILGAVVASEPFTPRVVAAIALVFAGVAVIRTRPRRAARRLRPSGAD